MNSQHWKSLSRFESHDFVANWYQKTHGRSANATKIKQINACFTQGTEYFENAKNSSMSVKPLLLYYGVLSISRGVILCNNSRLTEDALKASHGLEVVDWKGTLSGGIKNILDLHIRATDGTFGELVNVCFHLNSVSFFINATNQIGQNAHLLGDVKFSTDGSKLKLGDLLSRFMYTAGEYGGISGQSGKMFFSRIASTKKGMHFAFPMAGTPEFLQNKVNGNDILGGSSVEVAPGFRQPDDAKDTVIFAVKENNAHYSDFPVFHYGSGDFCSVIEDFPNGDKLTEFIKMYLIAYIIGMLVRYFPSKWISLLKNEKGDFAQPLLTEAVNAIEMHFAEEVLKQLTGTIKKA